MENAAPEPTLYQKYLGISGRQIPPNHYTLLGLQPLESDPETIKKAAQKRADSLREQKTDENLPELKALMNEIAAARLCLLDDARRKEYENFITGQKKSGVQMASPFAVQTDGDSEEMPESPVTSAQQAMDPAMFQHAQAAQMPQQAMDPAMFQHAQAAQMPQQAMDPMMFQQAQAAHQQMGQMNWQQAGSVPAQSGFPGQAQGLDFGAQSGVSSTGHFGQSSRGNFSSASKNTSTRKNSANSNSAIGFFCFGALIIITVAIGVISWNSDASRARRFYIDSQSAVNRQDFDEGRRLADLAIQFDKKDEYVRYREQIDIKQKKYEKRLRHEAARAEEDDYSF